MDGRERVLPLDLNGDGKSDFFWYTPGSGFAHMYLSNGDGTLESRVYRSGANGFSGDINDARDTAAALDLNGDGKDDILWYRPGAGFATAYLSNGDGTVRAVEYSQPGKQSNGFINNVDDARDRALPLDMNGDGKKDFLWYRPGSGYAGVYLSKGDGTLAYVPFSTPDGRSNGFAADVGDTLDAAAVVRLTADSRWGFIWFRPGGEIFEAYAADPAKSNIGALQLTLKQTTYLGRREFWMGDMADLIGRTPLKGIVMPGTHDSAMYINMTDADIAKNQRLDLYGQMAAGARHFDFRFARITVEALAQFPDGNTALPAGTNTVASGLYMTGHGKYQVDLTVVDAVAQIKKFLDEHPKEIAILSMNPALCCKIGNWLQAGADVITNGFGTLIYDQAATCATAGGSWSGSKCSIAVIPAKDVTPDALWRQGKRVILLDESVGFAPLSTWPTSEQQLQAGYKDSTNGIANIGAELDYMAEDIRKYRQAFFPASAAGVMLKLVAALTPSGELPCYGRCGFGPIPLARAFNPSLSEWLRSGQWMPNALNIISIDNIGEDDLADVIINLNNQNWVPQVTPTASNAFFATDVAEGPDGTAWLVNSHDEIFKRPGGGAQWTRGAGAAERIAVDPKGVPWVLSREGNIFRYNASGQWDLMPGLARDIGIGANGSVWVLGVGQTAGGYEIYRWTGSSWTQVPGAAVRISVDAAGRAWSVNGAGAIFRYNLDASSWDRIAAADSTDLPVDVGAGGDGSVWLATNGSLWRFNGNGWDPFQMNAQAVSVGYDGTPWVIQRGFQQLYYGVVE